MRRICRLHQCHEMPCRNHGSTARPTSTSCRRGVVPLRCFVWSSGQSICRVSSSVGECGPGQYHYLRLRIPLNRKLSSNLGSCHSSVGETSSDSIPISRFNVVCLFVNFTASLRFSKTIENQQKPPKTTKRCLLQNGSPVPRGVHLPMSSSEMMLVLLVFSMDHIIGNGNLVVSHSHWFPSLS